MYLQILQKLLSGNDLGKLGNIERLPSEDEQEAYRKELDAPTKENMTGKVVDREIKVTAYAKNLLDEDKAVEALTHLMAFL